MHLPTIIAAAPPPTGSALDDMLRLIGIAVIVFAVFKGIKLFVSQPSKHSNTQRPATPTSTAPSEGITPEIIAAIAAAVATFTGRSHRIISIKPMSTSWEKAGRQSVLTSHRIR